METSGSKWKKVEASRNKWKQLQTSFSKASRTLHKEAIQRIAHGYNLT
jgi:hypothetical protein